MQASASDEVLKAPIGARHSEMVSRDLWNVPTNRLINMGYLQVIYGEDTGRLRPGVWLNDCIMDVGLKLIQAWHLKRRLAGCDQSPIFAFSTQFFNKLLGVGETDYDYESVRRWGRKARVVDGDIFKLEILLIVANPDGNLPWIMTTHTHPNCG